MWGFGLSKNSPCSLSASILCSLSAMAQDTHHVMAEKDMPLGLYSTKAAASSPLLTFKPCCYRLLVEQLPPYFSWTSSLLSMVMNRRGSWSHIFLLDLDFLLFLSPLPSPPFLCSLTKAEEHKAGRDDYLTVSRMQVITPLSIQSAFHKCFQERFP